jgi:Sulfotransferase domain
MRPNALPQSRFAEMWQAGQRVFRVLAGRSMAGRGVTVFPDDIFLVSYPRSGNTWTRFLIGNLLNPDEPVSFVNIEARIPEIYFNPDHVLRRMPRPRLLKSHECFQPLYKRVIYITRDPRDVAVSFYHHHVKAGNLDDDYPLDDYVPRFVAGEFDPAFGSWGENVQSWLAMRAGNPDFLLLQYEQMLRSPESMLETVGKFIVARSFPHIDTAPERIHRAVELSSPERMRALEKQQSKHWILTRATRQDKPFVRSAKTGEWRNVLSPRAVYCIEGAWGELMQRLGYILSRVDQLPTISEMRDREITLNSRPP